MPLRIDTSKCEHELSADHMEALAHIMYAVGVGQIRNNDEALKLYRRYYMLRMARNQATPHISLFPLDKMLTAVGAHTNVSDMSDFQFNKSLLLEMAATANARINVEMGLNV